MEIYLLISVFLSSSILIFKLFPVWPVKFPLMSVSISPQFWSPPFFLAQDTPVSHCIFPPSPSHSSNPRGPWVLVSVSLLKWIVKDYRVFEQRLNLKDKIKINQGEGHSKERDKAGTRKF